ncbi:TIGR01777 family oxidoreductase [uncultured Maribacter sp.]|uniref:TIGR01777 family oxidoreductase n=1 Tax=uncultured Maribacter sp. TaxID=431308 RepID=UPI0026173339|nr:TIGR01777 family oxidoreductase [uncultured Maribacter sp.]
MKVLITGATGLVGREIVECCLSKNFLVHYLTTSRDKIESTKECRGFYWNPSKGEIDVKCFLGVTSIINLAGSSIATRWTPENKRQILDSRINSLKTLRNGLQQFGGGEISSFISASAIGIYPNSLSNYYTEDEKEVDSSFLGDVVRAWEQEIDAFKTFNFALSKIRIGLVLSEKKGALPKLLKPIQHYLGAAFGNGAQWQSWIHVKDVARMFLFVMENNLEGIFNGVGPNPVTNTKMVREIAKAVGRPLFLPNIPVIIMRLILGKMSYLLFASQRVSSKKIEEEGFVFLFPNIRLALKDLCDRVSIVSVHNKK